MMMSDGDWALTAANAGRWTDRRDDDQHEVIMEGKRERRMEDNDMVAFALTPMVNGEPITALFRPSGRGERRRGPFTGE